MTERITMTQPIDHADAAANEGGFRTVTGGVPEPELVGLGFHASRLVALVVMA
jgi:hypothetical protein